MNNILKTEREYENIGEPCIVNILLGPLTVHYREVLLYIVIILDIFGM